MIPYCPLYAPISRHSIQCINGNCHITAMEEEPGDADVKKVVGVGGEDGCCFDRIRVEGALGPYGVAKWSLPDAEASRRGGEGDRKLASSKGKGEIDGRRPGGSFVKGKVDVKGLGAKDEMRTLLVVGVCTKAIPCY